MTGQPLPPPGWYPDPADKQRWRWWSGSAWTDHTADAARSQATQQPSFLSNYRAAEQRIEQLALIGPILAALASVGFGLINWFNGHSIATYLHAMRILFDQMENGTTATLSNMPSGPSWDYPFSLISLVPFIITLVWQYRSAQVARALGYKFRFSPGFGVVSWFIPIANFWIPYVAVRDMFPDGHEARHTVSLWWTTVIIGVLASPALYFAAGEARGIGAILLALVIVNSVALCVFQRAVIRDVSRCHQVAGN